MAGRVKAPATFKGCMHPQSLQELYFYSKVIGSVGTAVGVIYGILNWMRATYKQNKLTNDNVALLMSNHLPHLQSSLDSHGDALGILSSDIRNIGTQVEGVEKRQEDLRKGVHTLGESFLRHLENTSKESPRKRSRKV